MWIVTELFRKHIGASITVLLILLAILFVINRYGKQYNIPYTETTSDIIYGILGIKSPPNTPVSNQSTDPITVHLTYGPLKAYTKTINDYTILYIHNTSLDNYQIELEYYIDSPTYTGWQSIPSQFILANYDNRISRVHNGTITGILIKSATKEIPMQAKDTVENSELVL